MSKGEAAERSRGTKIAKQESKCRNKAAKFELRQLLSSLAICLTWPFSGKGPIELHSVLLPLLVNGKYGLGQHFMSYWFQNISTVMVVGQFEGPPSGAPYT